jgi:exopolysaccharide production protein ExoQ
LIKGIEKIKLTKISWRLKLAVLISLGLVVRASFFIRKRDANAFNQVDASNFIAIIFIALSLLFIITKKGFRIISIIWSSPFKWFILYCIYCAITALWSIDPIFTIYRSMELLIILFLIAYIVFSLNNPYYNTKLLLIYLTLSLISGLGYPIKIGNYTLEAFHTNTYSLVAAFSVILGFYFYRYSNKIKSYELRNISFFLLILSVLALIIGTSSASNISFLLAVIFIVFINNKKISQKIGVLFIGLLIIYFWVYFEELIYDTLFPNKNEVAIRTGTGRINMWGYYINGFLENPVFGYGFPSGEKMGHLFGWETTSSTHNMFLSVAINTGVIGLFLFTTFIISYTKFLIKRLYVFQGTKYIFGVWIIVVVNSLSMPALGSNWIWVTSPIFFVMIFSLKIYSGNIIYKNDN